MDLPGLRPLRETLIERFIVYGEFLGTSTFEDVSEEISTSGENGTLETAKALRAKFCFIRSP